MIGSAKGGNQLGDIIALTETGERLTNRFVIECKAYKDFQLPQLLSGSISVVTGFWYKLCAEAWKSNRWPLLVARQNNIPTWVGTNVLGFEFLLGSMTGFTVCLDFGNDTYPMYVLPLKKLLSQPYPAPFAPLKVDNGQGTNT